MSPKQEPVQYTFHHGIPIVVADKDKDSKGAEPWTRR